MANLENWRFPISDLRVRDSADKENIVTQSAASVFHERTRRVLLKIGSSGHRAIESMNKWINETIERTVGPSDDRANQLTI
jgi:hypothetical protein